MLRVYSDISKARDRACYKGILSTLKRSGISGNLIDTITDF